MAELVVGNTKENATTTRRVRFVVIRVLQNSEKHPQKRGPEEAHASETMGKKECEKSKESSEGGDGINTVFTNA